MIMFNHLIALNLNYGNFCSSVQISEQIWSRTGIEESRLWKKAPDWKVITYEGSSFNTLVFRVGKIRNWKSGYPANKWVRTWKRLYFIRNIIQTLWSRLSDMIYSIGSPSSFYSILFYYFIQFKGLTAQFSSL